MRLTFFLLFILFSTNQACTQIPQVRPPIANPDFDQRLTTLLSFTVPLIGVETLYQNIGQYQILDAREREEYDISHIPGAIYIGYKDFDEKMLKNLKKNRPTVVYCSVGYRSEKIAERLLKQGFTQVYNLYGSLFEWANRAYPLENANGLPTHRIHTYNREWSQWIDRKELKKMW